jgi:hypothetical protein
MLYNSILSLIDIFLNQDRFKRSKKQGLNMQVGKALHKGLQGVTKLDEGLDQGPAVDFESYLKNMLTPDAANNVSEEELFSGLISERLKTEKSQELSDKYNKILSTKKTEMQGPDGYVRCEDAAKDALRELRDSGDLTGEEADKIYSEAFAGAQLDGNTNALYDNRGGAGDDTIAVSTLEQALLSARTITEKFDKGEETVAMRSLDEASNGKSVSVASVTIPESEDTTDLPDEPTQEDQNLGPPKGSEENIKENLPSLELGLGFSKSVLTQNIDKTLFSSLSNDKDKAL